MPKFSIIIPVYKVEEYLCECVDSVLMQTFFDYECILVDDGSPDNCPVICNEYASKDTRFRVVHQENRGLSVARNIGITAARGEYIVLLDSDDILVSDCALQNLCNILTGTNAQIVYHSNLTKFTTICDHTNMDVIESTTNIYTIMQFFAETKRNHNMLLAGWLFTVNRVFLIQNNLLFKENIVHEDEHWVPRLFCSVDQIIINHNPFYGYRYQRVGSIMSTMTPKRLLDSLLIIQDFLSILKNEKTMCKRVIYFFSCKNNWFYIFSILSNYSNLNPAIYKKIVQGLRKTVFCILHPINLKNFLLFLCVMIFGITHTMNIRIFFKNMKIKD